MRSGWYVVVVSLGSALVVGTVKLAKSGFKSLIRHLLYKMSEWRATKALPAFIAVRWGCTMVLEVERRSGRLWIRRKSRFDGDFLIWNRKGAQAARERPIAERLRVPSRAEFGAQLAQNRRSARTLHRLEPSMWQH